MAKYNENTREYVHLVAFSYAMLAADLGKYKGIDLMKNDLMHGQKEHKKAAERKEELCHFFSFAKANCWEYSQKQHNSQTTTRSTTAVKVFGYSLKQHNSQTAAVVFVPVAEFGYSLKQHNSQTVRVIALIISLFGYSLKQHNSQTLCPYHGH